MGSDKLSTFFIGDSDQFLLGFAAVLSARYQIRRKGGGGDLEALDALVQGAVSGAAVPLDDVPRIWLSVDADKEVMRWLLGVARPSFEPEEDDNG